MASANVEASGLLSRPFGCQVLALAGLGNPEHSPFSTVQPDGGRTRETIPLLDSITRGCEPVIFTLEQGCYLMPWEF